MNFILTVGQALLFYERCIKENATTVEEKIKILEDMEKQRQVFKQTDEQVTKRLAGKKVLRVQCKPPKHA